MYTYTHSESKHDFYNQHCLLLFIYFPLCFQCLHFTAIFTWKNIAHTLILMIKLKLSRFFHKNKKKLSKKTKQKNLMS